MNFGFDDDLINNVTEYAIFNEWDADTSTQKIMLGNPTPIKSASKATMQQKSVERPVSSKDSIFDKIKRLCGK